MKVKKIKSFLVIDKAYKVLDSKQKEQLRTLLDLRKEKMKQRFED